MAKSAGGGEGIDVLCPGWPSCIYLAMASTNSFFSVGANCCSPRFNCQCLPPCLSGRLELHIRLHHGNYVYSI